MSLNHQALLEGPRALAGHRQLRPRGVLEAHDQAAPEVGLDLGDPGEVDDRAPVDARELPGIEPRSG